MKLAAIAAAAVLLADCAAAAEVSELRIGRQYGLPYMQLVVMEDQKLIEQHAKLIGGGDLKVDWVTVGGPAALNDGIISGTIDVAAVGLPNLVTMWEKTRTSARVRAISGMNAMPLLLITRNPAVKRLEDFSANDRIALPSVKISMQAILLEMAAEKAFGADNWEKLDPLTVSMGHPDAFAALGSGKGEVTAHFSSAPFQYRQLKQPGIHQVLSSYDIIGPHSVSSIVMTARFHDGNPATVKAIIAALKDATAWIKADKRRAAETYLRATKDRMPVEELLAMLNDPNVIINIEPRGADRISAFMHRVGRIKAKPERWQDFYYGDIDALKGQ